MSLGLLFKINAIIIGLNGLSTIFFPYFWFNDTVLEASSFIYAVAQVAGVGIFGSALLSWRIPDVAGEGAYSLGVIVGIIHLLFVLLFLYQWQISQIFDGLVVYLNLIISIIFASSFFYYSKKE
jgi:hypothetical protein